MAGAAQKEEGIKHMELQIVNKPDLTFVGLKYHGKPQSDDIPQLWNRFMARFGELRHVTEHGISYGVSDNFDESTGEFDYVAAVRVSSAENVPDDMIVVQIPAQSYAVFSCTLANLGETYQQIYGTWLPQSGYRRASAPEFEVYGEDFNPNDPNSQFSVFIPIVKP